MNRVKLLFVSFALLSSVTAAIATRPKFDCTGVPNYYWNGSSYILTGVFGRDYYCALSTNTCTYFLNGNNYQACRTGSYTPLTGIKK